MTLSWGLFGLVLLALAALRLWRLGDARWDRRAGEDLLSRADHQASTFDPSAVETLPEPAQRYFRYTISRGAPLFTVAEIDMCGEIGLGNKDKPLYRPMRARQILAPPHGLVWRLWAGAISGSDGVTLATSWTRFWLFGVFPLVRFSGGKDHHRSAFGRVVSEAAFWAPASLLPSAHVRWEAVNESTARAIVISGDAEQAVDITTDEDGQPTRVTIQRWSNANADKVFRWQPFGGFLSEFRDFEGYRLPTRVEGGNHIGTADYFPFFRAKVRAIRFPQKRAPRHAC